MLVSIFSKPFLIVTDVSVAVLMFCLSAAFPAAETLEVTRLAAVCVHRPREARQTVGNI